MTDQLIRTGLPDRFEHIHCPCMRYAQISDDTFMWRAAARKARPTGWYRAPDNILPRTVIKLPLRDGNQPSIKLECVIFRVEILDAEVIAFRGSERCGELFDFGALRGVALYWYLALTRPRSAMAQRSDGR